MKLRILVFLTVLTSALAATAWYLYLAEPVGPPEIDGAVLSEPRALPEVPLRSPKGATDTQAVFGDRWTVVFFGFTHCPDVCPATLAKLARAIENWPDGGTPAPSVVFVSVDPQRDTPERLAEYTAHFHPGFRGVTSTPDHLRQLSDAMGVAWQVLPAGDETDYEVSHSSALLLVDPRGRLAAVFTAPHRPDRLARDLSHLIDYRNG